MKLAQAEPFDVEHLGRDVQPRSARCQRGRHAHDCGAGAGALLAARAPKGDNDEMACNPACGGVRFFGCRNDESLLVLGAFPELTRHFRAKRKSPLMADVTALASKLLWYAVTAHLAARLLSEYGGL